jgi:drug/metabolite transporter (DMT)-like permease
MQSNSTELPRTLWPGVLMAAVGSIGFSGKAIIVKLSYRYDVDAVSVIMYRMLFALPAFLLLAWWAGRGKAPLTGRDWRIICGLGFCGYYLASFLDFAGLQFIGANLERLILYLNPTLVLLVGLLVFKVEVTRKQWLALSVSYLGVLVAFSHDISVSGNHVAIGAALVFASAVSYALYLAFSGQAVKRLGALRLTGLATSVACILCITQFFVLRSPSEMIVAREVIWLAILNATLCTFVPVLLVMMSIERIGAGVTAQIGMLGPLSTIALSYIFLNETLTLWMAGGTTLVLSGIWMLMVAKR